VFVVFGATGDLAKRMVLPAFYRLASEGMLPSQWVLVGNGRGEVAHEDFHARVRDAVTARQATRHHRRPRFSAEDQNNDPERERVSPAPFAALRRRRSPMGNIAEH
jgi:glucose-6-phosphate 1-dehydrogenase